MSVSVIDSSGILKEDEIEQSPQSENWSEEWDFGGIFDLHSMVIDPCSLFFSPLLSGRVSSFFHLVSEAWLESSLLFSPSKGLSTIWPNSFATSLHRDSHRWFMRSTMISCKLSWGMLGKLTKHRTLSFVKRISNTWLMSHFATCLLGSGFFP